MRNSDQGMLGVQNFHVHRTKTSEFSSKLEFKLLEYIRWVLICVSQNRGNQITARRTIKIQCRQNSQLSCVTYRSAQKKKNVRRNCDQFSFSFYFSLVQKGGEILQPTAKFSNTYTVITEMRCIIIGNLLHWIIFDTIHTKLQRHQNKTYRPCDKWFRLDLGRDGKPFWTIGWRVRATKVLKRRRK